MQSYLVGNGCRHLGLFCCHFLVMGILLVMGLLSRGMHPSSVGLEFLRWGVCNFGHGLSFVGVTGLVMGCHL